jgi:hypothetical protein
VTSGLKEEQREPLESKHHENRATREKGETNRRRHKHSLRKRNGGTPVGCSGRIALSREQCSVYTRCWVTTSKQTTKHPLLRNKLLISTHTQPLLGKASANKQIPTKTIAVQ